MGLVLYSQADGDPSPSTRDSPPLLSDGHDAHPYLPDLSYDRHLPPSGTQLHDWHHGPSKARLSARRQASWAYRYEYEYHNISCGGGMRESSEVALLKQNAGGLWPRRLRPHQIRLLQQTTTLSPKRHSYNSASVRGHRKSVRDACINEMAASRPRPPCPDRSRPAPPVTTPAWTRSARRTNRPPSLERQGAFRDASTTKRRLSESSTDGDTAELYRLGLLYDNEHACGAGFGLDTIVHDVPTYSISVAEGGRSRGRARGRSPRTTVDEFAEGFSDFNADLNPTLPSLDLSFSNLADDAALARFLQDEEMAAYLASVPEDSSDVITDWSLSPPSSSPVRVIYELEPEMEMGMDDSTEEGATTPSSFSSPSLPSIDSDSSSGSDAGDWVMDMAGSLFEDDTADNDDNNDDSNPDDTWFLLPP
ncbi:hypothetical protein Sste5346_002423 [Sporothrix stenoceras]|uniref:Uncharacterized protein n=1 Tax=Sporothrix stenoceras TaxID=5173 RepID=A0ABR3ZHD0_9PEZI